VAYELFQGCKSLFEFFDFQFLLLQLSAELLVESLDRRQGHTVGIYQSPGALAVTMQLFQGAHAPSRVRAGAPAGQHSRAAVHQKVCRSRGRNFARGRAKWHARARALPTRRHGYGLVAHFWGQVNPGADWAGHPI
jgi:hypothetical protein